MLRSLPLPNQYYRDQHSVLQYNSTTTYVLIVLCLSTLSYCLVAPSPIVCSPLFSSFPSFAPSPSCKRCVPEHFSCFITTLAFFDSYISSLPPPVLSSRPLTPPSLVFVFVFCHAHLGSSTRFSAQTQLHFLTLWSSITRLQKYSI